MGLFDRKKRHADPPPDFYVELGKLKGEVESLTIQWASWKDEMRRLLQRMEKRDQRAAQREATPPEPTLDPLTERVLRRRNYRVSRHGSGQQG